MMDQQVSVNQERLLDASPSLTSWESARAISIMLQNVPQPLQNTSEETAAKIKNKGQ